MSGNQKQNNHGGKREGAGRKKGTKNRAKLREGTVRALRERDHQRIKTFGAARELRLGRPRKYEDPDEMFEAGCNYIEGCYQQGWIPTQYGLICALGISPSSWSRYIDRPGFIEVCEMLMMEIKAGYAQEMTQGNVAGCKDLLDRAEKASMYNVRGGDIGLMDHESRLDHLR